MCIPALHLLLTSLGQQIDDMRKDQWRVIRLYLSRYIDETIKSMTQLFKDCDDKFGKLVTQMTRIEDCDKEGSRLDLEVGDKIITLHQLAHTCKTTPKDQDKLINFSWSIVRNIRNLDVRMKPLLGSKFAVKLYGLICLLGHPLRTHHTIIRVVMTVDGFRTVQICVGHPPPQSHNTVKSSSKVSSNRQQLKFDQQLQTMAPSRSIRRPTRKLADVIRSYLSTEGQVLGLARLQPMAIQDAALLVGSILCGDLPHPGCNAYYEFGFAACRNQDEEQALSNFYRQQLLTTQNPVLVFKMIVGALHTSKLAAVLKRDALQSLRGTLPTVERFLTTPPQERLSVYRLTQFIRDTENDEPVPCLKRDYGFRFCTQREHVTALKTVYTMVLDRVKPSELHGACLHGRLIEFTIQVLGYVKPELRRLLQNDYPHCIGFDDSRGIGNHETALFKESRKV